MFEVHSTLLFSSMIDRLYQSTSRDLTTCTLQVFLFTANRKKRIEEKKGTEISQFIDTLAMLIRRKIYIKENDEC